MKRAHLLIGFSFALTSAWAIAQDSPESLLPPGFDKPAAKPKPARASTPTPKPVAVPSADAPAKRDTSSDASAAGTAVVQDITGGPVSDGGADSSDMANSSAARIPSIEELEKLSPEELDETLGIKPQFNLGASERRSMKQIGLLSLSEGGLPSSMLAGQSAALVKAALVGNKGTMVSRWGHILLRRALASRLDAPAGMLPADFAAMRTALLVRMGEGEAARGLVQDIDPGNYTPELSQAAFDSYIFTADFTGICPIITAQNISNDDEKWQAFRSICSAFRGEGNSALSQLERQAKSASTLQPFDYLLAEKYAGAAGKSRRAVKIEWDGVKSMSPLRYALTIAVGLTPPDALMKDAGTQYDYMAATAPMLGLERRAAAADTAAGAGILSSAAMVDIYSQLYADQDISEEWSARADLIHNAYAAKDAAARLTAMQSLWDSAGTPQQRYSRQVLTAYAAARLPVDAAMMKAAPDLIGSMLAAGLDQNAMRWFALAKAGSQEWGVLALATPAPRAAVEYGDLKTFYSDDNSSEARRSAFLLAGLAGLERITPDTTAEFSKKLGVDLTRQSKWTQLIDQSAAVNNAGLVSLLAGLGMQGSDWSKMTPLYLYHIVSALRRVGMEAEARMIAAEAVTRS